MEAKVVDTLAYVGSGSIPDEGVASKAVRVDVAGLDTEAFGLPATTLRQAVPGQVRVDDVIGVVHLTVTDEDRCVLHRRRIVGGPGETERELRQAAIMAPCLAESSSW